MKMIADIIAFVLLFFPVFYYSFSNKEPKIRRLFIVGILLCIFLLLIESISAESYYGFYKYLKIFPLLMFGGVACSVLGSIYNIKMFDAKQYWETRNFENGVLHGNMFNEYVYAYLFSDRLVCCKAHHDLLDLRLFTDIYEEVIYLADIEQIDTYKFFYEGLKIKIKNKKYTLPFAYGTSKEWLETIQTQIGNLSEKAYIRRVK